jgi:hypothetical protein
VHPCLSPTNAENGVSIPLRGKEPLDIRLTFCPLPATANSMDDLDTMSKCPKSCHRGSSPPVTHPGLIVISRPA